MGETQRELTKLPFASQETVKMTSLVDIWMGELAKLRERRRAAGPRKVESEREGAEQVEAQDKAGAVRSRRQSLPRQSTLSEATVCMLMDRFAPC
ncbi:hypothetical protein Taro_007397 [Colocasia esculenta]|uniref:Uncharacterized protein n=1 Tax=Colocasia esculenta TaxID=4460 RepID=A0A843TZL3_COLES|nr:hypothetical protein [Colocasia esculenta]